MFWQNLKVHFGAQTLNLNFKFETYSNGNITNLREKIYNSK